jgi:hypothetical protein
LRVIVKGFVSRLCKELLQLFRVQNASTTKTKQKTQELLEFNNKNTTHSFKQQKELKKQSPKEDM